MFVNQIKEELTKLKETLEDKGATLVSVSLNIETDATEYRLELRTASDSPVQVDVGNFSPYVKYMRDSNLEKLFADVRALIASLPDARTAEIEEFNRRIASAIDWGREHQIPDTYVNSLHSFLGEINQKLLGKPL